MVKTRRVGGECRITGRIRNMYRPFVMSNKLSGSVKDGKFIEQMSDYHVSKLTIL
jgi:hypothetical protein